MRIEGENKYFTAQEARMVANEIQNGQMNKELDEIYAKINEARFKGNTSITLNYFIMKSTEEFLKNKGFTIKVFHGCQWDPATDTTISW